MPLAATAGNEVAVAGKDMAAAVVGSMEDAAADTVDEAAADMVPLAQLQTLAVLAADKVVEKVAVLVDNFVVGWLEAV